MGQKFLAETLSILTLMDNTDKFCDLKGQTAAMQIGPLKVKYI